MEYENRLTIATVLSGMMYPSLLDGDNGIRVSVGNKKDQGTVKAKHATRRMAHITLLNDKFEWSNDE